MTFLQTVLVEQFEEYLARDEVAPLGLIAALLNVGLDPGAIEENYTTTTQEAY